MEKLKDIQETFDFDAPHCGVSELTREESLVWDVVREHRGKDAAVLGPVISAQTGIPYNTVRGTISGLITHHDKLIGSCGRGYYLIIDPDEVDEVYGSLRHRGLSILYRAARIKKRSIVEVFGQGELDEACS